MSLQIGGKSQAKRVAQHMKKSPYTPFSNSPILDTVVPDTLEPTLPVVAPELQEMQQLEDIGFTPPVVTQFNPYAQIEAEAAKYNQNMIGSGSVNVGGTKGYEGYRDKIYTDTTGNATIGYGHKLTPREIKSGIYSKGITKAQGEALYAQDRANHTNALYKREPWIKNLSSSQREALEDMSFNMGPSFLDKFSKARTALQQGNYEIAAQQFENSLYRRQVGQRALDNAARLRQY